MVVPIKVVGESESLFTYALLDCGSSWCIVSDVIKRLLNIDGKPFDMRVASLDTISDGERDVADVRVEGMNGFELTLKDAIFGEIVTAGEEDIPHDSDLEGLDHCEGVRFESFPPA